MHSRDIAELRTPPSHEMKVNVENDLPKDQQLVTEDERVHGLIDRALNGVLDGNKTHLDLAIADRLEDINDAGLRDE